MDAVSIPEPRVASKAATEAWINEYNDLVIVRALKPLWPGFAFKQHQEVGIEWMLEREESQHPGGLLCDEMGLGKTMEILGVMKNSLKQQNLLLCPKAVIDQWCVAAIKSRFNVQIVSKTGSWSKPRPFFSGQPFLCITNYEKVAFRPSLVKRSWDRLLLDEAHRVRNARSATYDAVNKINRKITWVITATPLVNKMTDIYSLCNLIGYKRKDIIDINTTMSEVCLHRSMASMRLQLPELPAAPVFHEKALDFETEEEEEFYQGIQGKLVKSWKSLDSDNWMAKLALIMKLRQLSVHPAVYVNARKQQPGGYAREYKGGSTKFSALLKNITGETKPLKWIVFCQFRHEMELLQEFLEKSPAIGRVQQYHGGIPDAEKVKTINKTKGEVQGHDILLLQLQSGGVGLNLQHFTKIVFMSPWWTSALMDQAVGRAVRIGQTGVVDVIRLVLKEEETMNIDRFMLEKADEKRSALLDLFSHASTGLDAVEELEDPQD